MNELKNNLRKTYLNLRNALPCTRKKEASSNAIKLLKDVIPKETFVLSFASFNSEINIWGFNYFLAQRNSLLLPKMQNQSLEAFLITNPSKQLKKKTNSPLLEPISCLCQKIPVEKISQVIVPGLVFDNKKQRLGYGGGYYDFFMNNKTFSKIGIGYKEQLHQEPLPIEPHDVSLDFIWLF